MKRTHTKTNIGKRAFAGFVDYLLIFAFDFAYIYAFGAPNEEGGYTVSGLPALVPVLFWLLMTMGMEQLMGATIGNTLVDLKPVPLRGFKQKLSFTQSLKRHLLDTIDMMFFGFIGYITIKNTEKN